MTARWNVWCRATHDPEKDLEEIYNYMDAVNLASLMHVVLRNTRTVALSNISEAVNMCASIMTDRNRMVRQTIWHTQKLMRDAHESCRVPVKATYTFPPASVTVLEFMS